MNDKHSEFAIRRQSEELGYLEHLNRLFNLYVYNAQWLEASETALALSELCHEFKIPDRPDLTDKIDAAVEESKDD